MTPDSNQDHFITVEKEIPAGLAKRLASIIYDSILLFAVLFAASIPIITILGITYGHPLYPLYVAYIYAISFLYFGWFWVHGGQTPAMKTWKIQLIGANGISISWKQALYRYLGAFISAVVFGLGFLWSVIRKDKASWHDLFSKTRLIQTSTPTSPKCRHQ
jgi:uncharacterized RDD family membrane protein YckC